MYVYDIRDAKSFFMEAQLDPQTITVEYVFADNILDKGTRKCLLPFCRVSSRATLHIIDSLSLAFYPLYIFFNF